MSPAPDAGPLRLAARVLPDSRFRYLVVGGGTAVVEFVTFNLLIHFGIPPAAANAISFCLALVVNFSGYRWWSFAGDHGIRGHAQFVAYLALALANLTITTTIVHWLTETGTPPWIAKLGCMTLITAWNYFILSRFIFRRAAAPPSGDRPTAPRNRR